MRIIEIETFDEDLLYALRMEEMEELMKFINRIKKNTRINELEENIKIQISNNRMLREQLTKEREYSKEQALEIAKLKKNIIELSNDNEHLANLIKELLPKTSSSDEETPRIEVI